ncbi:unnamed protein product, partial [Ostreobium quekettii]
FKAYLRWRNFPKTVRDSKAHLPSETAACPGVTAAFLQVLAGLQDAETVRSGHTRNIFKVRPRRWEAPIFHHCHKRSLMRPQQKAHPSHKARRRWHVTTT